MMVSKWRLWADWCVVMAPYAVVLVVMVLVIVCVAVGVL